MGTETDNAGAAARLAGKAGGIGAKLWTAIVVLDLLVGALGGTAIVRDRAQAVREAETATANLSAVVEQNIAGIVERADGLLLDIRDVVEAHLGRGPIDHDRVKEILAHHPARMPEADAPRVADANGVVRMEGRAGSAAYTADREHFIRARDDPDAGLIVGRPVRARQGGHWILPLARRISHGDGSFAGIVVVPIRLDALARTFARLDVGRHGGVALRDNEMRLILRVPELEGIGAQVGNQSVTQRARDIAAAGQAVATYTAVIPADGRTRTVTVRKIGALPLYMIVNLDQDEYLAGWRLQAIQVGLLVLAFAAVSAVAGWLLSRAWRRQQETLLKLAESEQVLQTVNEYTGDWVFWRSADRRRFHYLSPACEAITGYGVADFQDDPGLLDRLIHADDRQRWDAHLDLAVDGDHEEQDYRIVTRAGEVRWVRHHCRDVVAADGGRLGRRGTFRDVSESIRAEAVRRRQLSSLKALNEIGAIGSMSLPEQLREALAIGMRLLGLEFGIVSRVEGEKYFIQAQVSPPNTLQDGQVFALGETYCSITLASGDVVAIHDMGHSPHAGHPCYRSFQLDTYIGAPVRVAGSLFGTVNFSSPRPYGREFDDGDREFVALLARWVGAVLQRDGDRRQLVDSERLLRDAQEVARIGSYRFDVRADRWSSSQVLDDIFGIDAAYPRTYAGWLYLVHADERAALDAYFQGVAITSQRFNREYRIVRVADGAVRWVQGMGEFSCDAEGNPLALVGVIQDITRRKQAELDLLEKERRMHALLDANTESMALIDTEGKLLAINAVGAQRLGGTPEGLIGRNAFDMLPADLAQSRRAKVKQAMDTGEPLRLNDRRGAIAFENSLYPIRDESGDTVAVAIYAKDVTEQRRSEQIDALFHRLDLMLLKWQMNLDSIAQVFLDEILPVFDLAMGWIARAENDGSLTMLAVAERAGMAPGFADHVRTSCRHWRGDAVLCAPAAACLRSGSLQKLSIEAPGCEPCRQAAEAAAIKAVLALPVTLRGSQWGVMAFYAGDADLFERPDIPPRLAAVAGRLATSFEASLQQEWLTLLETALANTGNAVLITDAAARILWVNNAFCVLSGFSAAEVVGRNPRMFRSGAQDAEFYRRFWQTIAAGETWHGEIVNLRRDGSRCTLNQTVTPLRNAEGEVSHYVAILEDISERKAAEERIAHMANFDMLTDLPNRNLFFDRLQQALALARREGRGGALLFIDLDRFKEVNDRLGHEAGDQLLKAVAARCREQVRESDTVARLAGDEFTVILPNIAAADDAGNVAAKIVAAVRRPFEIAGTAVEVGASIGIALFPGDGEGGDVEAILNAADAAMYRAKQAGRNTFRFHDNE